MNMKGYQLTIKVGGEFIMFPAFTSWTVAATAGDILAKNTSGAIVRLTNLDTAVSVEIEAGATYAENMGKAEEVTT